MLSDMKVQTHIRMRSACGSHDAAVCGSRMLAAFLFQTVLQNDDSLRQSAFGTNAAAASNPPLRAPAFNIPGCARALWVSSNGSQSKAHVELNCLID